MFEFSDIVHVLPKAKTKPMRAAFTVDETVFAEDTIMASTQFQKHAHGLRQDS